jgi:hypothetical protein
MFGPVQVTTPEIILAGVLALTSVQLLHTQTKKKTRNHSAEQMQLIS